MVLVLLAGGCGGSASLPATSSAAAVPAARAGVGPRSNREQARGIGLQSDDAKRAPPVLTPQARRARALYAHRIGVVIGIDDYGGRFPTLKSAVSDTERVAATLSAMGFDTVHELKRGEATNTAILGLLEETLPRTAGSSDLVVVYFAGHGYTTGGEGYVLPANATADVPGTGVSLQRLKEASHRLKARHVMYLTDSCFSGRAFRRDGSADDGDPTAFWTPTSRLVEIIVAGRENETANETDQGGVFTSAVLEGLGGAADVDADLVVSGRELAGYVTARVAQLTGDRQHPQWGLIDGDGSVALVDQRRLPKGADTAPRPRETIAGSEPDVARIHAAMEQHDWRAAERLVRDLALRVEDAEVHLLLAEIYLAQDGLGYATLIDTELRRAQALPLREAQSLRLVDLRAALEKLRRPAF